MFDFGNFTTAAFNFISNLPGLISTAFIVWAYFDVRNLRKKGVNLYPGLVASVLIFIDFIIFYTVGQFFSYAQIYRPNSFFYNFFIDKILAPLLSAGIHPLMITILIPI